MLLSKNYTFDVNMGEIADKSTNIISNRYTTGNISESSINPQSYMNIVDSDFKNIGGLVGYFTTDLGSINNTYSTGFIEYDDKYSSVGGLIGYNSGAEIATTNYWNETSSGISTSDGGTAFTNGEMLDSSKYVDWDFETIWNIEEGSTYPYLRDNTQDPLPQPEPDA
jgi:hypothetical protein